MEKTGPDGNPWSGFPSLGDGHPIEPGQTFRFVSDSQTPRWAEYDYRTADRLKQQDDRIEALEARVKVLERILASQLLVPMDILK